MEAKQICKIVWQYTTQKVDPEKHICEAEEANFVVDWIPCNDCGKVFPVFIAFNNQENFFTEFARIESEMEKQIFTCPQCDKQYKPDSDGNVFEFED